VQSAYQQFCDAAAAPFQHHAWWLDTVCPGWSPALYADAGGRVRAVMPWARARRWGLTVLLPPPLTSYGGPWFDPAWQSLRSGARLSMEKKAMETCIAQAPRALRCIQNFQPGIQNALPFHWAGYRITTRYTYWLPDASDAQALEAGFSTQVRRRLQMARENTEIRPWPEADILGAARLYLSALRRRGWRPRYDAALVQRCHAVLQARGLGHCLAACDRHHGDVHAVLYLVLDRQRASILFSCYHEPFKSSGALHGLIAEALRLAGQAGVPLDFEGSMDASVGMFFRGFGGALMPYFQIIK
jgi:hypothetical protein